MQKKISVIIPAYNAGPYLRPAVESVLAQGESETDIIVVDDGTTDGSIGSIRDLPITILTKKNGGEASARNAGVLSAQAPLITFLDSDDLLTKGSLEVRLKFLNENPQEWVVGGLPSTLISEDGSCLSDVYKTMCQAYPETFRLTLETYRRGPFFPLQLSLYLYRREVFDSVGLFDESLPTSPDCEFHYRLLTKLAIPVLSVPIFERRIHRNNLSLVARDAKNVNFTLLVYETLRKINLQFGIPLEQLTPWENEYLNQTED